MVEDTTSFDSEETNQSGKRTFELSLETTSLSLWEWLACYWDVAQLDLLFYITRRAEYHLLVKSSGGN